MNRLEMIKAAQKQEHMLALLAHCQPQNVPQLFEDGYTLSAKHLEVMYCLGYSNDIIMSCAKKAQSYDNAEHVYKWLCGYMGEEEAEDFLLENRQIDEALLKVVSLRGLERHQCWDALQKRRADDILFAHALYDKMSLHSLYRHKMYELYFKRGGIKINPNDDEVIAYLVKEQNWSVLCKNLQEPEKKNNKNLLQALIDNKQFDAVFGNNPIALTRYDEGIKFLQRGKWYYILAQAKLYDKIDWKEYFKTDNPQAVIDAVAAKQWEALIKNRKHWALLRSLRLKQFVESFQK